MKEKFEKLGKVAFEGIRRKSDPWRKRSKRNGRQRSFSPLTRPSKCRVGRWGAILFHSSYNARVFRCEAPSKQHEWNRIKELCFREHQERQLVFQFLAGLMEDKVKFTYRAQLSLTFLWKLKRKKVQASTNSGQRMKSQGKWLLADRRQTRFSSDIV